MASFPKMILTNSGKDMIVQAQLGQPLIFTKGKYGDSVLTEGLDPQTFTDLISPTLDLPLRSMESENSGQATITVLVARSELEIGFFGRELGLFAKIGDAGTEALFCYTNAGSQADFIPNKDDLTIPYDELIDIVTVIGNATDVSIIVDKNKIYVTAEQLEDHNTSLEAHRALAGTPNGFAILDEYAKILSGLYDFATQEEAQAGTNTTKPVNSFDIAAAIKALAGDTVIVESVIAQNGYIKFANGLIWQWLTTTTSGATSTVIYPIAFPNKVVYVNYSMLGVGTYHGAGNVNLNSMSIYRIWYNDTYPGASDVCIFAIGY